MIGKFILDCESSRLSSPYTNERISFSSDGNEIIIISDLHLAEGRNLSGNYTGTENFFYDDSLKRFIEHLCSIQKTDSATLIINGDFIDFMRIVSFPDSEADLIEWKNILAKIGLAYEVEELKNSIDKKEKKYGLKTNDYKSVWKLNEVINGHPEVFNALSDWIERGNKIIISKGNHDLEFIWPAVRNYLRLKLAEIISGDEEKIKQNLLEKIFPNLIFADCDILIDDEVLVAHGHLNDKFSRCVGDDILPNGKELNIPFGSFFNRYLINKIELIYPFFDNVRPRENILPLLMRERFFLGLRVLFQHIPFLILIIPKRYYRYMFARVLSLGLVILIPVIIILINFWNFFEDLFFSPAPEAAGIMGFLRIEGLNLLSSFAMMFISYLGARIVSYFQLEEPSTLAEFAKEEFKKNPNLRIITFGHTHNPDQINIEGKKFFNTGTWIPIVENSSAEIRSDKTFTILRLTPEKNQKIDTHYLERWSDDSGRIERLILIERVD
jgi:UDP-2,3-diacylglucosamine pyrophosphatase LpxH